MSSVFSQNVNQCPGFLNDQLPWCNCRPCHCFHRQNSPLTAKGACRIPWGSASGLCGLFSWHTATRHLHYRREGSCDRLHIITHCPQLQDIQRFRALRTTSVNMGNDMHQIFSYIIWHQITRYKKIKQNHSLCSVTRPSWAELVGNYKLFARGSGQLAQHIRNGGTAREDPGLSLFTDNYCPQW